MAESLGIALFGCGTVGGGVAELLLRHRSRNAQRAGGVSLDLKHAIVRDPKKKRIEELPAKIIGTDWKAALRDPAVDVVVELVGGTGIAKEMVLAALAAGKHVVTANKALLAAHGREIFDAARAAKKTVSFEAAVAGGIPIIKALAESLAANQITAIQAILNGTSNFILTRMTESGATYTSALAEAQALGYAEADPTLDVDGSDAAHKLAVLVQIAFGVTPDLNAIEKRGIAGLDALDIRFAAELGYTIKLLAEAWVQPGADSSRRPAGVALHVSPVLLRQTDMLAQVRGAFNAIRVQGDAVGETLYQGAGAGKLPTASGVMSDLIDLAVGRTPCTFAATNLWSDADRGFQVVPSDPRADPLLPAGAGEGSARRARGCLPTAGERGDQHRVGRAARSGGRAFGSACAAGDHGPRRGGGELPPGRREHQSAGDGEWECGLLSRC